MQSVESTAQSREWKRYYRESSVIDFQDHELAYYAVAEILKRKFPDIFRSPAVPTYVLGGYNPKSRTPDCFKKFCRTLSPSPHLVLVDQNAFPLASYHDPDLQVRIQESLEDWVNQSAAGSIDGLFLDCTLDFMNDRQVVKMAEGLRTSLSPNGIVWVVNHKPIFKTIENLTRYLHFGVKQYSRDPKDVLTLVSGSLKPVAAMNFEVKLKFGRDFAYLIALTSVDSSLPELEHWNSFPLEP